MSEGVSEKTPDSGPKALEDIQPCEPRFPSDLTSTRSGARQPGTKPYFVPTSRPREPQEAFRAMVQGLMQENARLWSEREAFNVGAHLNLRMVLNSGRVESWEKVKGRIETA